MTTANPSTGAPSIVTSIGWPNGPASVTFIPISSATPWPPRMINRGMSLEAIAALLGHRSMRMTLTYARISNRTVAEEYFRVTQAVEASYESGEPLPASVEGANMRRIAAEHRRLLGNGHCTRPTGLDCTFESICERCGFFETGPQFLTILRRQRDDAVGHGQEDRAQLLEGFIDGHRRGSLNVLRCPQSRSRGSPM